MSRPSEFDNDFSKIYEFRKIQRAPVDIFDDWFPEKHSIDSSLRFKMLVFFLLSSQTKDTLTYSILRNLEDRLILSLDGMIQIDERDLAKMIKPVSFFNTKAKNLKKICNILRTNYHDDIPGTYDDLIRLPGIGPKTVFARL
jgi:endonuclease III